MCSCNMTEKNKQILQRVWLAATHKILQSKATTSEHLTELCNLQANLHLPVFFSLTVGSALSAPSVAGRCTPVTGCGGLGGAFTTWPVLPVSPVRGSCRLGRSSAWWRGGYSAAATMTSCWRTFAGLLKTVTDIIKDVSLMIISKNMQESGPQ